MNKTLIGAICLSIASSLWGGVFVVSKYVLDYIPPLTLMWLRYAIAFISLFTFLMISQKNNGKPKRIEKKDWILLLWIGFIGYFVSIAFQFIGTNLSDAHTGALITSATPAFIVLFARFVLKEKLTIRKSISLFVASLGVVFVIGWNEKADSYLWGSIILVGAAITWALLSVYVKVASERLSSLTITTYAVLFALIFTTPLMIWELQTKNIYYQSVLIVLGIIYLGLVSTAGAFYLWNKGLELIDAGIGSLFFFFQPIIGSFLGWLLLKEELNVNFYIGGLLIITAVIIITFQGKRILRENNEAGGL